MSIENELRDQKYWRIGWAIMHMRWWERILWALGFGHRFMTHDYWDQQNDG